MSDLRKDEYIAFRTLVMPPELNFHGTLFGGSMLEFLDKAGAITAMKHANTRVFLVSMKEVNFKAPAQLNDTITVYGKVVKVGNTSMTLKLEAWRTVSVTQETELSAEAEAVYVSIDDDLQPKEIANKL